jgi:NAD(P)-dependent dehydrogenase (short-subunit alcohol dehydrogenase family)
MMSTTALDGHVVIITGAGGRLGQHMVRQFAARGATVAAVDLETDRIPDHAQVHPFAVNMTQEDAVRECFGDIAETLGPPDGLVHTVGMWAGHPLLETTLDDWRTVMDVNLTSTFLAVRETLRHLDGGGRIIAMASGQGADQGVAEQGAYAAAKAGVIRLVEAVTDEYAGQGVTAHAIAPSMILFGNEDADAQGVPAEDIVDLALYVYTTGGPATNGATLRAYGTLR